MNDLHELRITLQSRFPIVCVETHEEVRALGLLRKLATETRQAYFEWSVADGLSHENFRYEGADRGGWSHATVEGYRAQHESAGSERRNVIADTTDLQAALQHIDKHGKPGIYALLDPHPWFEQAAVLRMLREIAHAYPERHCTIVLVSPSLQLPPELARQSAKFSLALPDAKRIKEIFKEEIELFARSPEGRKVEGEQEVAQLLMQHVTGLCEEDVRRMLRMAVRDDGAITRNDLMRVMKLKREMFGNSALEIELETARLTEVGGMAQLKRWLQLRQKAFVGQIPGLPTPRGVLLLGVQGGGKSLAARTIAGTWGVPLARLDVGSLFNKYQGETERNLREALKAAEALAPCVLWVDEIEKALAQSSGSDGDGGVSRRVLGTLLTWMAERDSRVFLTATANDIRSLPPELLRKGRFDEIFFVDLPDQTARQEIFNIHLQRRELACAKFDVVSLATAAEGFTGAEIEQAIVSGLYEAHFANKALDTQTITQEIARTRPISVVMAERIADLRSWARERAVMA